VWRVGKIDCFESSDGQTSINYIIVPNMSDSNLRGLISLWESLSGLDFTHCYWVPINFAFSRYYCCEHHLGRRTWVSSGISHHRNNFADFTNTSTVSVYNHIRNSNPLVLVVQRKHHGYFLILHNLDMAY